MATKMIPMKMQRSMMKLLGSMMALMISRLVFQVTSLFPVWLESGVFGFMGVQSTRRSWMTRATSLMQRAMVLLIRFTVDLVGPVDLWDWVSGALSGIVDGSKGTNSDRRFQTGVGRKWSN